MNHNDHEDNRKKAKKADDTGKTMSFQSASGKQKQPQSTEGRGTGPAPAAKGSPGHPKNDVTGMIKKSGKATGFAVGKLFSWILNIFLTLLLICVIVGVVVGSAFAIYVKNYLMEDDFDIVGLKTGLDKTSRIYYMDDATGDWTEIESERLHGTENRMWVSIQDMPANLTNAFVAIEDKRFYEHHGVDWYRTLGATLSFITGGDNYGGSTITQQLIKNFTEEDDTTIQRKVKEIFRALSLTKKRSRDEILEMYLNTILLSRNNYGVQAAANYFFDKDVSELSLVECAALAAIPKSPTKYDPQRNPEQNKLRRDVVLDEMEKLGWITSEECDEAKNTELVLNINQGGKNVAESTFSYFTDALIEQLITDFETEYGYTREMASNLIFSGGLEIHATVDPRIQDIMEEVFEDPETFPVVSEGIQPESAMVVIDPYTGDVVGIVGGRGEKTVSRSLNRATKSVRQIGSSIKPITVYAPAMDMGLIQYSTVIDDTPVEYNDKKGRYWPVNAPRVYDGKITVNYALERSKNTVAVKVLEQMGVDYAYRFAKDTLGLHSLVESDRDRAPLALGGLTYGLTVLEVAAAYSIFPNDGIYSSPRLYTEVLAEDGTVLLSRPTEQRVAVSESTAAIMTKMMQNAVARGTGAAVTLKNKVNAAGKTGSTDEDKDRYFVGFTPYYVGACWFGYDTPKYLGKFSGNPALTAWDIVMTKIHSDLIESGAPLEKFDSSGLVTAQYCKDSGKAPGPYCALDLRGNRIETGYYKPGTEPTEVCDCHVPVLWDTATKRVASPDCPPQFVKQIALVREEKRSFRTQLVIADAQYTYRDVPDDYTYPAGDDVPFYANLLTGIPVTDKDGVTTVLPEYAGTSGVSFPANRYCTDHAKTLYKTPPIQPEEPEPLPDVPPDEEHPGQETGGEGQGESPPTEKEPLDQGDSDGESGAGDEPEPSPLPEDGGDLAQNDDDTGQDDPASDAARPG